MFNPFEFYFNKKFPNEEDVNVKNEAQKDYISLSAKKKLKFIKKAEKKYDSHVEEHPDESLPTFSTYLSFKELDLLMKSYGFPEKVPVNSKLYFIKKLQEEAVHNNQEESNLDELLRNTRLEGEKHWKSLNEERKNEILDEYHKKSEEYTEHFFEFARALPQQRISDYKEYLEKSKKSENKEQTPKSSTKRKSSKVNEHRELNKKFTPVEIYIEKHKTDVSNLAARNELRSQYVNLNDKKKLKYIKKAEENYDAHEFDENKSHPLFASYLSKKELQLLLESYGMPESIPNFSAYYLKLKMKEGMVGMKNIFESLKQLSPEEKQEFQQNHAKAYDEFSVKKREFLDKLPPKRIEDYNYLTAKAKKPSPVSSGSPAKKVKLEDHNNTDKEKSD